MKNFNESGNLLNALERKSIAVNTLTGMSLDPAEKLRWQNQANGIDLLVEIHRDTILEFNYLHEVEAFYGEVESESIADDWTRGKEAFLKCVMDSIRECKSV